jgi:hypothetical protein
VTSRKHCGPSVLSSRPAIRAKECAPGQIDFCASHSLAVTLRMAEPER